MNTKLLLLLLASSLLGSAAWLVHVPGSAQDPVPEKYRDMVSKGLEYLVKNQHKDGHWESDGGKHPVAMTGLVGLALFMEGSTDHKGKYSANIRKAVDWLIDKSKANRDGLIFSEHPSETTRYMQGHGLATLFLAGAYDGESDDARRKKLNDVLTRAVKYIVNARSTRGGWYHTSKVESHDFDVISATAIQIQAQLAAAFAGIPVPNEGNFQEYLKMTIGMDDKAAKSEENRSRPVDTAAALACRSISYPISSERGGKTWDELCNKWFSYCQCEIPTARAIKFGRDELAHYYYAQAAYNLGGDAWNGYRTAMFDHLQSAQNKDGRWPAGDGIGVGPVYSTAIWCTVLQLDKNRHPATQRDVDVH